MDIRIRVLDGSRVWIQPASKETFTKEEFEAIVNYAKNNKDRNYGPVESYAKNFEKKADRTNIAAQLAQLSKRPDVNEWRTILL